MRILTLACAVFLLTVSSGCATLFSGSSDMVTFNSEPAGAEVLIGGITRGRTPVTIPVKRPGFGSTSVTMRMDGHDPVTFQMSSKFNTVSLLNLFVPVGFIVDAVTGSITKYDQVNYTADMSRGSITYNMEDLDRTTEGALVVPDVASETVVVRDADAGVQMVFNQ